MIDRLQTHYYTIYKPTDREIIIPEMDGQMDRQISPQQIVSQSQMEKLYIGWIKRQTNYYATDRQTDQVGRLL